MKQFIITEMKLDKKKAENLLLDLWDKLFEDDDPHGTMQWFWDQFEFTSEEQVKKIVSLFMPLCNDTNLMLNRGIYSFCYAKTKDLSWRTWMDIRCLRMLKRGLDHDT